MRSPLGDRRLEVLGALRSRGAEPYRLDRTRVRYALGVSATDLKIPFCLGEDAQRILVQSARQLAWMVIARHRHLLPPDEHERLVLNTELASVLQAPESLAPAGGGPEVRALAELAPRLHRGLTGGVLSTWLGSGGGGRSLVAFLIDILQRAVGEMRGTQDREETPALVALMLGSALASAEAGLRACRFPAVIDAFTRSAAGLGVLLAAKLGVERGLRDARLSAEVQARVEAPFNPLALMGGPPTLSVAGNLAYGCELSAGIPGAEALIPRMALSRFEELEAELAKTLGQEAELAIARARMGAVIRRGALLVEEGKLAGEEGQLFWDLYFQPGRLPALLGEDSEASKERKTLGKLLLKSELEDPDAREVLDGLGEALKEFSVKEPAGCVGLPRHKAREAYAACALGALADLALDRTLRNTRRFFELRSGREAEGGLEAEHASGRLYRLSTRKEPLLRMSSETQLGALFVDVKDFTRRTSLLGQAAMADFLRNAFYLPILSAAKAFYGGMNQLEDKGGVSLNNLLGDALSMSGQIESLVALALEIRRHLAGFERALKDKVSVARVEESVRAIEAEFAKKLQALPPGASPSLLNTEKEAALARARGEGLEASVFISYGPAPLLINIEDEIFGRSKVAIADRINESARGTARSGSARARADALLEQERERRRAPSLKHPWAVFVDAPLSFSVSVRTEARVLAALKAGDEAEALRAMEGPIRDAVKELSERSNDAAGDIYNSGAALSEQALKAFEDAKRTDRAFRHLELSPERLHPDFHRQYYFPPGPLLLVASFGRDGNLLELFRYAGRAMFKGLESSGGIGVFEIVCDADLFGLFVRHHAREWFARS